MPADGRADQTLSAALHAVEARRHGLESTIDALADLERHLERRAMVRTSNANACCHIGTQSHLSLLLQGCVDTECMLMRG